MTDQDRPELKEPRYRSADILDPTEDGGYPVPMAAGAMQQRFGDFILTSQPVQQRRRLSMIKQQIAYLANEFGREQYIYSWRVKGKDGRTEVIEGPTIRLAMDLARTFGNNACGVMNVEDKGTHWLLNAAFIDLETGFNTIRPFMQRKSQSMGMEKRGQAERQEDLVFQIGVSKAQRNVIVNALRPFVEFMMEEAKKSLLSWVENNPDKGKSYVETRLEQWQLPITRVEAVVGRKYARWTPHDVARVMMEFKGIEDGMQFVDDLYPEIGRSESAQTEAKAEPKQKTQKKTEQKGQKPDSDARPQRAATEAPAQSDSPTPEKESAPPQRAVAGSNDTSGEEDAPAPLEDEPIESEPEQKDETQDNKFATDKDGRTFDPALHQVDENGKPVLTAQGYLKKKTGPRRGTGTTSRQRNLDDLGSFD